MRVDRVGVYGLMIACVNRMGVDRVGECTDRDILYAELLQHEKKGLPSIEQTTRVLKGHHLAGQQNHHCLQYYLHCCGWVNLEVGG